MSQNEEAFQKLLRVAQEIYPDGVPVGALHDLAQAHGENPQKTYPFSGLEKPKVMGVDASTVSAFTFGVFAKNRVPYVVLQKRDAERCYNDKGPYGIWGGFLDHKTKEQPADACLRECREETTVAGDERFPGLQLEPKQLLPRKTFLDYDHEGGEPRSTSTAVSVFGCLLTPEQVRYMTELQEAVDKGGRIHEVEGYDIMPLAEAVNLPQEKFTHSFAQDALKELHEQVKQGKSLEDVLSAGKQRGR